MGGTSTSAQSSQQQTSPWAAAQPMLSSIMGQLQPQIANSGLTSGESSAINQLSATAAQGNPFAGQITASTNSLLNGGGAMNQAGAVNQNYQNYYNQTNPMASNTNFDPTTAPGMQQLLQTIQGDTTNSVNSQFAAAGRDMSGMNQQTLARGISQGEAAPLLAQYNTNVQNQQGAAQNLYNAGNATTSALSGMQTQANANTQAGVGQTSTALNAQNFAPEQQLALQQLTQSIPAQNLGLLAQIGVPIAGLGSQSSGSSSGTATEAGAQQFQQIMSGLGSLIPKGSTTFNF